MAILRNMKVKKFFVASALVASVGFVGVASVSAVDYPPSASSKVSVSGTPVTVSKAPPATVSTNTAVAVSGTSVNLGFVVPKAKSASSQIVKYTITIKPAKGSSYTKTVNVSPGQTIRPSVKGKAATTYTVTITAQTKSGKKTTWTGPKVKTGK